MAIYEEMQAQLQELVDLVKLTRVDFG